MDALNKWFAEKRGRRAALTQELGLSSGAISQWTQVPATHVLAVEAFTKIPRTVLRPDVFEAAA